MSWLWNPALMDSWTQALYQHAGRSGLEERLPYYKVLLVLLEVSILTPYWPRIILWWLSIMKNVIMSFHCLTAAQLGREFSFVVSRFFFSFVIADMKILFVTYLISTLGQILIKFFYFSWIWESILRAQWRAPKFLYFITRAVHSLLSGASVHFPLLPQREECNKEGSANWPHRWRRGGGGFEPSQTVVLKII